MTDGVVPWRGEAHEAMRALLPWYVNGTLEADEQAEVEAHLATCAECQADVRFQQRLEAEVVRLPLDVEAGWAQMQQRMAADAPVPRHGAAVRRARAAAPWLGWGVAAGLAVAVVATGLLPSAPKAEYRALSAAVPAPTGNAVVIFRPDTTEADMRAALRAADARLVDGPTAADGYMLEIPAAKREAALALLRTRHAVVLAQPIDATP